MEGRTPVGEMEGRDSRRRREELDGYRAKGNMKREPIYFPASLLLFVTSALLYLIELVFLPLGVCVTVCACSVSEHSSLTGCTPHSVH
jgi:hypothetical protein